MNTVTQILVILINLVLSLFATAVILRFILQRLKADFYNPLCQLLIRVTHPLLAPMRRIIPGLWGWDWAALILAYFTLLLDLIIITLLSHLALSPILLLATAIKLIVIVLDLYFYAIFLRALISWFAPNPYHPATQLLIQLTEPVLYHARRIAPPIRNFDFSPWLVLIALQLLRMVFARYFGI